jgi:hypothetical protein
MKHIKLFESFIKLNESLKAKEDLIFDWLPFDNQIDNPINSKVPSDVKYSDLLPILEKMAPELNSVGLFISHMKTDSGFIRVIINTNDTPFSFDISVFDENFNEKLKNESVPVEDFDPESLLKGTSILSRFGN